MLSSIKDKQGFTLVEVLIAIGVFTVGIMGAFTLALANINTIAENFNRVLAANMAREGVEIVRNMRDSNWLKQDANEYCGSYICSWDYGLDAGFYYIDYSDAGLTSFSCPDIDTCIQGCTNAAVCTFYLNGNFYDHTISSNITNMSRIIQIENICLNDSGASPIESYSSSACSTLGLEKIGIRVTSRVRWARQQTEFFDIDAVELMYNWRR